MAPLDTLSSRTPFAWLRERDIDLLLCAEIHAGEAATRMFARIAGAEAAGFLGAWVSHAEADGESDLVVAFDGARGHVLALIENKIAAEFQPDQAARYAARAKRWAAAQGVARVVTILLAPAEYMHRPGADAFEHRVSYEDFAKELGSGDDPRSRFLAKALLAGIEAYRAGYTMRPDETVTDMWLACWEASTRVTPGLRFRQPGVKPGRSTWFYFREADGFSAEERKRVVIVFKAERGQADLQFSGTSATELLSRVEGVILAPMKVEPAGKSASIRIDVPSIDFQGSALEQEAAITQGFLACEQLRTWFMSHRERLLAP